MNKYSLPHDIWEGFFCKLVTMKDGIDVREWHVFDHGVLVFIAETKSRAEQKWISYKLGDKTLLV